MKLPDDKVIITVAQTGALVTRKQNPNVPEQPDESNIIAEKPVSSIATDIFFTMTPPVT